MTKHDIPNGITVGTEIGDINRQIKALIKKCVDGDKTALSEIIKLSRHREKLLMPKQLRK